MVGYTAELDARQRQILQAIIQNFIATAEPVGSRAVAQIFNWALSPATIRNVMADLEEMGYIIQPHTSAGRVPTDKGYRFYVDSLMQVERLTPAEEERIQREYLEKVEEIEEVMRKASKMLSLISHQLGVVVAPRLKESTLKKIELIPLSGREVLVVLITNEGLLANRIVQVDESLSSEDCSWISRFLNEKFQGLSFPELRRSFMDKLERERMFYDELSKWVTRITEQMFNIDRPEEIYLEGTSNILEQPEFSNLEKTKTIFRIIEEKKILSDILSVDFVGEGIKVMIGSENPYKEMQECSLVISTYKWEDHRVGTLGIIGPKRMEYWKAISLVDFAARAVSRLITELSKG